MDGVTRLELKRLRDLEQTMLSTPLDDTATERAIYAELRDLLDAGVVGRYLLDVGVQKSANAVVFAGGEHYEDEFSFELRRQNHQGAVDWLRPSPMQRNRLLYLPSSATTADMTPRQARRVLGMEWRDYQRIQAKLRDTHSKQQRWGVGDSRQYRMIVCDGRFALGWVGLARDLQVPRRSRILFGHIVPTLKRRLMDQHRYVNGALLAEGLDALLERQATAVVIVNRTRRVLHANLIAQVKLDAGALDVAAMESVPLVGGWLMIERPPQTEPAWERVATHWSLTPRQLAVLKLVIAGRTNSVIASILDITEATVEFHVGRLLERVGVSNRAALASEVWSLTR